MVISVLGRVGPGNLGPQDTIKLVYLPFRSILIDLKQKENRKIGTFYQKLNKLIIYYLRVFYQEISYVFTHIDM